MSRITGDEISAYVDGARPDLANYVVHWTKLTWKAENPDSLLSRMRPVPDQPPFHVLQQIIAARQIRASPLKIKGGRPVVCFSESPLWAMKVAWQAARFNCVTSRFDESKYGQCLNYHPYGLLFSKRTIYRLGGRPVLYLSESDQGLLPDTMRWRTVKFEAPGSPVADDFTHEREWRCPSDVNLDKLAPVERPKAIVWTGDEREKLQVIALNRPIPISEVIALSELRG